jgi:uncharacterized protein
MLKQLMERDDGPFVVQLPREAGRRENRYAHLFGGKVEIPGILHREEVAVSDTNIDTDRLDRLEEAIDELRREIEEVKSKL